MLRPARSVGLEEESVVSGLRVGAPSGLPVAGQSGKSVVFGGEGIRHSLQQRALCRGHGVWPVYGRMPQGCPARQNAPAQGAGVRRRALSGDAFLRRYGAGRCPGVDESAPGSGAAPAQQSAKPIRISERLGGSLRFPALFGRAGKGDAT